MELRAFDEHDGTLVFTVERDLEGRIRVRGSEAAGRIWDTVGISEWVGEPGEERPQVTASSDPIFLPRLALYLRRQFRFRLQLTAGVRGWDD